MVGKKNKTNKIEKKKCFILKVPPPPFAAAQRGFCVCVCVRERKHGGVSID